MLQPHWEGLRAEIKRDLAQPTLPHAAPAKSIAWLAPKHLVICLTLGCCNVPWHVIWTPKEWIEFYEIVGHKAPTCRQIVGTGITPSSSPNTGILALSYY
jgi:hypothetical protein